MTTKRGRPRKPPKQKVKIKELLQVIDAIPPDDQKRQQLTPDRRLRVRRYVEELIYLEYVIANLKEDINENGEIELYKNGLQETRRTNPALTTYIDTIKAYNQLMRQVSEIIKGAELDLEKMW